MVSDLGKGLQIELYDATLRDGMQGEGMSLTVDEKLRVVHLLDRLGIHTIEAGFPASNPKERALFDLLAEESLDHAKIAAFGMTHRRGLLADQDPGLRVLVDCFAPICTIVGKTWGLHLEKVVRVDRDENLRMIEASVAFLHGEAKRVIYDGEHFFDAWRDDHSYALQCLQAALDGGAETIVLCDTNGSSLPSQIRDATQSVIQHFGSQIRVGIHCHNDAECGVANSLAGVEVGATQVQGTANGRGERTGNANLISIIANLQLKLGYQLIREDQLMRLTETAHVIDELLNFTPDPRQPYVGKSAFAHKGGLHVAGVRDDPATFEHVDPVVVGNRRDMLVSELAGKGTIIEKAQALELNVGDAAAKRILERLKELEHQGFQYEAADASFELLMRQESGSYQPLFTLESWRVIVEKRTAGPATTEATIKLRVGEERHLFTAEGNGPVNALDAALRGAIGKTYPHLRDIELVNFKVRILDETKGSDAITRVLIDASDGHDLWSTIGVSTNLIDASWQALVDSLEFAMQSGR